MVIVLIILVALVVIGVLGFKNNLREEPVEWFAKEESNENHEKEENNKHRGELAEQFENQPQKNSEYMIFYPDFKMKLLAKDGEWSFTLNGERWVIADCIERLLAFALIENNNADAASLVRHNHRKNITPKEIDDFFAYFVDTHPIIAEKCTKYDVPVYATKDRYLCIPNWFGYEVLLSPAQEKELLDIIVNNSKHHPQAKLNQWFMNYVYCYGLEPKRKRDINTQYEDLSIEFCKQHAIIYESLEPSFWYMAKKWMWVLAICAVALGIYWLYDTLEGDGIWTPIALITCMGLIVYSVKIVAYFSSYD